MARRAGGALLPDVQHSARFHFLRRAGTARRASRKGRALANSPSFEDKAVLKFFETSGRNLLAAEAEAGVRHHVNYGPGE